MFSTYCTPKNITNQTVCLPVRCLTSRTLCAQTPKMGRIYGSTTGTERQTQSHKAHIINTNDRREACKCASNIQFMTERISRRLCQKYTHGINLERETDEEMERGARSEGAPHDLRAKFRCLCCCILNLYLLYYARESHRPTRRQDEDICLHVHMYVRANSAYFYKLPANESGAYILMNTHSYCAFCCRLPVVPVSAPVTISRRCAYATMLKNIPAVNRTTHNICIHVQIVPYTIFDMETLTSICLCHDHMYTIYFERRRRSPMVIINENNTEV